MHEKEGRGTSRIEEAFVTLSGKLSGYIYHLAGDTWNLGKGVEVDDIVQLTFEMILRHYGDKDPSHIHGGLFYAVARNLTLNQLRAQKRYNAHYFSLEAETEMNGGESQLAADEPGVEIQVEERIMATAITSALPTLTSDQEFVFRRIALDGMGHTETAEALNKSYGAVKSIMFNARKRIQEELSSFRE